MPRLSSTSSSLRKSLLGFATRRSPRSRRNQLETLEPRQVFASDIIISEFMADNETTETGDNDPIEDWIEIHNTTNSPVNLAGWSLTDDPLDPDKWNFPSMTLPAKGYLVVLASGLDLRDPANTLHTDFKLDNEAGYLALVEPDNVTKSSEYSPSYPPQAPDISYGLNTTTETTTLVSTSSNVRILVPSPAGSLPTNWANIEFNDASWIGGTGTPVSQGVGYDTGASELQSASAVLQSYGPAGYWRFSEAGAETVAVNQGTAGAALNATYSGGPNLAQPGPQPPAYQGFEAGNSATLFDGVNDFVAAPSGILAGQSQFTVMGWVKRGAWSATRVGLFGQNDTVEFGFIDTNTIELWTPNGGVVQLPWTHGTNSWHHIAATGDGTNLRIYIDGVLAATGGSSTGGGAYGTSADAFRIGGGGIQDATGNQFVGDIDEVAAFPGVALSGPQIQAYVNASTGIGGQVDFTPYIQTDIEAQMLGVNSTALVRIPFTITGDATFSGLSLKMQYDDGFVAYLNGVEVARANAPEILAANSAAAGTGFDNEAVIAEVFDLGEERDLLQLGNNVLSIHALNASASNPDLLVRAELVAIDVTNVSDEARYFATPTPGEPNGQGTEDLGPIIRTVVNTPAQVSVGTPVVVTAHVVQAFDPVASVSLHYRRMYAAETTIAMLDNGTGSDAVAGDGVYTAVIPAAGGALAGEMLRWRVTAEDSTGDDSRWPLFLDPAASPQYLGTMIVDPATTSQLPIFNWFINPSDINAANTRTGARASVFFNGAFYDNVYVRMRGGTSAGFAKKSYKFEFNDGYHFRIDPTLPLVDEINLNTTWTDKTYMRRLLSNDAYAAAGVPAPLVQIWRVEQNGDFHSVANFVEQADRDFLRRVGLDDDGALYKANNSFESASGMEKETRRDEPNTDITNFVNFVNSTPVGPALTNYFMDNLDVPEILSYLSAVVITHQNDHPHKNYFLYRDTEGSGEWQMFPQDTDLSFGKNYIGDQGGVLSDIMYADDDQVPGRGADVKPSHPFIGAQNYKEWNNNWNRLIDKIINTPVLQQMFLRRLRTVMDEQLQAPGTPADQLKFEQQIDALVAVLTPDAALDKTKWPQWGTNQTLAQAVQIMKDQYLAVRRTHLFNTHSIDNMADTFTFVDVGSPIKYIVPTSDIGTAWKERVFDETGWNDGTMGIGSEPTANGPFTGHFQTDVRPLLDPDNNGAPNFNGVYVRRHFNVDDPTDISQLTLEVKFDDGVAVYLNGTRLTLSNANAPANLNWNSTATFGRSDSLAINYTTFSLNSSIGLLVPGDNVISFHALNNPGAAQDPDLLMSARLRAIGGGYALAAGIPHAQDPNVQINFGAVDFNPTSGNQDEEYIQLSNPNNTAVDISGWQLTGGVTHTFRPGTVIPANGSLYVSPDVVAFRARTTGPRGGQGLLVQGNYNGHISNLGEVINLVRKNESTSATITTPNAPSEAQKFLRITEVMYHPQDPNPPGANYGVDEYDYIELQNIGPNTLDLNGVHFGDGVTFEFTGSAVTSLAPGARVLVVQNIDAFQERYPGVTNIAGEFVLSTLSNGGEQVKLDDDTNSTIVEFTYDDVAPWYPSTDGQGRSLVIIDPLAPVATWKLETSWRPSTAIGGSPGAADGASVVGRHLFYNQSRHDGNSTAANAADDGAIATDKTALMPGQTASFANVSSYTRGINGLMVDIAGLPGTVTAGDFAFKVGNNTTVSGWAALATAPTVSIRPGAGVGGSSRVSLIWPSGSIIKQWLQVTVSANANTGLATPDVFYFGNAIAESGNGPDLRVTVSDEVAARNNPYSAAANGNVPAPVTNKWDYNRDGNVSVTDQTQARANQTTVALRLQLITVPSALSGSGLIAQGLNDGNGARGFVDSTYVEIARGLGASSLTSSVSGSSASSQSTGGVSSGAGRLQAHALSAAYAEAESLTGKRRIAMSADEVDSDLLELLSSR